MGPEVAAQRDQRHASRLQLDAQLPSGPPADGDDAPLILTTKDATSGKQNPGDGHEIHFTLSILSLVTVSLVG